MSTKWVHIQMGNFRQSVKAVRVHKDAAGGVMIVAADGKVYETHISNVVIISDAMESPENNAI